MKSISKLNIGLEDRTIKRVNKLKTRDAYRYFLTNLAYPQDEKLATKYKVSKSLKLIENKLPEIKDIIRSIKKYIPHIWDQNAITAVYLLLGKTYSNLETILSLAKGGHNLEIVEIARAAHESLDLAFLFLEDGQEKRLENWYKGKIINNKKARELLHRIINTEKNSKVNLPIYDTKTDIYGIYSLYTHSSYSALLDSVDVFHEDFDYDRIAGMHYTLRYFDAIIINLVTSLLLELKNVYVKLKNLEKIQEIDNLLNILGNHKATPEEIKEIFDKYNK
jgi:hypothetical protein